jgi:hypothetical protein
MITPLGGAPATEGIANSQNERGFRLEVEKLRLEVSRHHGWAAALPRAGEPVRVDVDGEGSFRNVVHVRLAASATTKDDVGVLPPDESTLGISGTVDSEGDKQMPRSQQSSTEAATLRRMLEVLATIGIPEDALQPEYGTTACDVPPFRFLPEEDGSVARVMLLCAGGCGRCDALMSAIGAHGSREDVPAGRTVIHTFADLYHVYTTRQGHEDGEYICADCRGTRGD